MDKHLPKTLKRLSVFEDSHRFYYPDTINTTPIPWPEHMTNRLTVEEVLARKSLDLQHLAVSFKVNAEEVFRHCQPTWTWPHLQSLALTSQLLQPDPENHEKIKALLRQAAVLVQQMPKIRDFVLWNGEYGHACAFIYRMDRDRVTITWRGTWNLDMSPRTVQAWQQAASALSSFELQIKKECIPEDVIISHGDAIHHLELPCQVVDPASLWQIRREARSLYGAESTIPTLHLQ